MRDLTTSVINGSKSRSAFVRLITLVAVVHFAALPLIAQDLPILKTIEQIHQIKAEDLEREFPVDLECIVMCYEPDWAILFVSDGRDGYYAGNPRNLSLKRGDRIRILGKLNEYRVPTNCTYEPSDNGIELPSAKVVDFERLQSALDDSQFVEIEGQFIGINSENSQTCLEFRSQENGRFRALINGAKMQTSVLRGMLGKRVRMRGVVGARFDEFQRWSGFQIWLSSPGDIEELEKPGEPYLTPLKPIAELTAESIVATNSSYFRTEGVMTYQLSPSMLLLQDSSHQLFVELNKAGELPLDRSYKVTGTLDTSVTPPILRMAEATPSTRTFSINNTPAFHSLEELVAGDFSGQLVQTDGTYFGPFEVRGQHGFFLQSQNHLLPVFVDSEMINEVVKGTKVRTIGIWIQQKSLLGFNIGSNALHVRTSDVQLGTQLPWLLMSVIGISVAVTSLCGAWVVTLRQQVRRKTQQTQALNTKLTNDLKARTIAEENLRTASGYLDVYRKIVDQHAIVAETDSAGTIIHVNEAFCRISGYSRDELIGKNHRILNSGVHPLSTWTEMYKSVADFGYSHGEICNRKKNGDLYWIDTTIASLFENSGKLRGYFAISTDITSLKEAQVQAESANRSKSEFLANMSHEIRTPMTAILGYADILAEQLDSGKNPKPAIECIETIRRNGEHLLSIINDILDISKIEANKMTAEKIRVSPLQMVQEVVELMQVKSKAKALALKTEFDASVPQTIQTDPTRLRQILVNLVGNAIKFTEIGGVTITVRKDVNQPDQIYFDVIDTGIGLREDQFANLFRSFEQADTSMTRKFGGTGLGLRISKRLAEILGGTITAASSNSGGCIFTASVSVGCLTPEDAGAVLPSFKSTLRADANHEAPNFPTASANPHALAGFRILLVEDGPDNQRLISFHLRKAGAMVEILENGRLAVERFTQDGSVDGELTSAQDFDVILMDMQMPIMDGYEATRLLRKKGCRIPILAVTAHAMELDHEKCLDAGCDSRLTKPIDKKSLIDTCVRWGTTSSSVTI
jgi:PAS domain S-box-containing protein